MNAHLTWEEAAVRLALTLVAGALLGVNRETVGHAAGLRTTMLVCLAASLAMMQAEALLVIGGKTPSSFGVMDMMRLPLGILSGMGFIGAGAILRRGALVVGLTTAATLWIATVIGLLIGGGQLWLGVLATALSAGILWVLKRIDVALPRDRKAAMTIRGLASAFEADAVKIAATRARFALELWDLELEGANATGRFMVRWRSRPHAGAPVELLNSIAEIPGVQSVRWSDRAQ